MFNLKYQLLKTTWSLSVFLLLSSCFRPHHFPQYVDIPPNWRIETDESSTLCNLDWWKAFQDPILDNYIEIALKNNQDIKIAATRVLQYYDRFEIANTALFPSIYGNAGYSRTQFPLSVPFSETTIPANTNPTTLPTSATRIVNNFQVFLALAWELDFWGRLWSASEAAYEDLLGEVEARRTVVLTVVTSVANAYILLRQLDSQLIVSRKTLNSRLQSLQLAQFRFELGETSELEVKQAESEVEDAAIRVIEFERDIFQQEDALSILLGENPRSIERGNSIENFVYPIMIPAGLPSDLLTRRPDIMQAEYQMMAANSRVTEARALFFPQIELTGFYGNQSDQLRRLFTSASETWQYGLNALEPLFDAGRTYFSYLEATEKRKEALYNYRQTILKAFKEVNDALIAVQKNRELVNEHQRQVKVLQDYLHLATLRYQEGEIDYLNVLDAERALFNAQLQEVQAQSDSFIAIVRLYGALGGGWVVEADHKAISLECVD